MLAVARGITRFDGSARFTTWMLPGRHQRRARRGAAVPAAPVAAEPSEPSGRSLARGGRPPGRHGRRRRPPRRRRRAAHPGPRDFRVAVVLRDLCDLDYAEIAEVLDVPPGTVRSRIARGRAALAEAGSGNRRAPTGRRNEDDMTDTPTDLPTPTTAVTPASPGSSGSRPSTRSPAPRLVRTALAGADEPDPHGAPSRTPNDAGAGPGDAARRDPGVARPWSWCWSSAWPCSVPRDPTTAARPPSTPPTRSSRCEQPASAERISATPAQRPTRQEAPADCRAPALDARSRLLGRSRSLGRPRRRPNEAADLTGGALPARLACRSAARR